MALYLVRRFGGAVLILIGISFITFVLLYVIPADPAQMMAGRGYTNEATIAAIREQLGLDDPFLQQYLRYVTSLLQGDLGRSYLQKTEVAALIW